jgi:DNA adenine methylase
MPATVSPLRYPGGKTKFYTYVREILSCNDMLGETYIEPFAGGAGLALKLLLNEDVSRIVINDFDPAIYSFWHSVLYETEAFCELIENAILTTNQWNLQHSIYLESDTSDPLTLGFATFYLNRTNISGVVKGGMIGGQGQNGKYGLDARFNRQTLIKKIKTIASHKEQIVLLNLDARELLQPRQLRKFYKIFINLDPPYVKKGAQLYKNAFSESDHRELCELVKQCRRKWIVTYDVCPLVADLYKSYRSSYLDVTYSIQASKKAKEYIFFSDTLVLPKEIKIRCAGIE